MDNTKRIEITKILQRSEANFKTIKAKYASNKTELAKQLKTAKSNNKAALEKLLGSQLYKKYNKVIKS